MVRGELGRLMGLVPKRDVRILAEIDLKGEKGRERSGTSIGKRHDTNRSEEQQYISDKNPEIDNEKGDGKSVTNFSFPRISSSCAFMLAICTSSAAILASKLACWGI